MQTCVDKEVFNMKASNLKMLTYKESIKYYSMKIPVGASSYKIEGCRQNNRPDIVRVQGPDGKPLGSVQVESFDVESAFQRAKLIVDELASGRVECSKTGFYAAKHA